MSKKCGVRRRGAVLQHVEPARIVGLEHAHVIGHEVEDQAHAVRAQRGDQRVEIGLAADLGIELVVVHHVVAVRASRPRAQEGRRVQVAHAQLREVGHDRRRVGEGEVAMQLDAIRRARDARRARVGRRGLDARRASAGLHAGAGRCARMAAQMAAKRPSASQSSRSSGALRRQLGCMLLGGGRDVGLFGLSEDVLELQRHEHAGRARDVAVHARDFFARERAGGGGGRRQALARERTGEPLAIGRAVGEQTLAQLRRRKERERVAHAEVAALPVTLERGQVVRADRDERLHGIGSGREEFAVLRALEIEHAIGQDAGARGHGAEIVGNGAQVLAHHERAMTAAFERKHADHLAQGIAHVGAFGGAGALGNPVQAREPHHVVDAQAAGVAHVRGHELAEGAEAIGGEAMRNPRRQAPVLPGLVELVGRRAHVHAAREALRIVPGLRTAGIGAHGEIAIQADGHAGLACHARGMRELQVRLPLQVEVIVDVGGKLGRERLHARMRAIAILVAPHRPSPRAVLLREARLQRVEARGIGELVAALA